MASRRDALTAALGSGVAAVVGGHGGQALARSPAKPTEAGQAGVPQTPWARGREGQRRADLGNGRYLNPILAGDYPDPSILKDGEDYYMTHSSFDASPGLVIWHSRDLVNWLPIGTALARPLGTVFAVDIARHGDRYYIYIPFMAAPWSKGLKSFANIYVIHAPSMHGPWSEPVDLGISGLIDPGHVTDSDGTRWLYLSGVNRIRLAPDGLSTVGAVEPAYDGWHYPDDWVTEAFALEGPKLFRRGAWFYLVSAVGGTSGPATGHMVIVARSRSAQGPWENCPHNPIVHTTDPSQRWLSRGHATMVEGPGGQWYMVYHGYENGFRTLGRQCLLEPLEWTADGWPRALGGDLSAPLPMPAKIAGAQHGIDRSDDFSSLALGTRWTFYGASPEDAARAHVEKGELVVEGKGTGPGDCAPLTQLVGDQAYEIAVTMTLEEGAQGGLLLFYNDRMFFGMGHDGQHMTTWRAGKSSFWQEPAPAGRTMHLKITNDRQIVTMYYSLDGKTWTRHGLRSEVSGVHANTMDDLSSLRPALYAAGKGAVRFSQFTFRATETPRGG